jgi:predicted MFS family arabinose efflux permease
LAGALVGLLSAPLAIAFDAASYLLSVISLSLLHVPELPASLPAGGGSIWNELREGLGTVFAGPLLRTLVLFLAVFNLFGSFWPTLFVLYLTRGLAIGPALLGSILAVAGVSGIAGALFAGRLARHYGLGPTLIGAGLLIGLGGMFVPLASGPRWLVLTMLVMGQLLEGFAGPLYVINVTSMRQAKTPPRLLGRVNASMPVVSTSMLPLGTLLGGALGQAIGPRPALFIGGVGVLVAALCLAFSSVRSVREVAIA